MSNPSLTPSQSDLARESAAAAKFFAKSVPGVYKGKPRGGTKDIAWRTNVAFWDAYDLEPAKLGAGDKASVNAWLRIEAEGTRLYYAAKIMTPAVSWDPNAPTWPLPTAPTTAWKSGSVFAAKRPFYGPQTRYHTGIDLAAEAGTPLLAPEAGRIVDPDSGWEYDKETGKGVKSIVMTTVSGFTVLIGGIRPGSSTLKAGDEVVAGEQIAEIGRYSGGDAMAHFTLYKGKLTKAQVSGQKKWVLNGTKPSDLIDPAAYLTECSANPKYVSVGAFMEGDEPGLVENDVEGGEHTEGEGGDQAAEFVFADNQRTSLTPCGGFVCAAGDALAWTAATLRYLSAAKQQLATAKSAMLKGKAWTPEAAQAEKDINVLSQFVDKGMVGLELDEVIALNIDSCREALAAGRVLEQFAKASPVSGQKTSSGGSLGLILGLAAAAVITTVVVVVATGKRSKSALALLLLFLPGCGPHLPEASSSGSGTLASTATDSVISTSQDQSTTGVGTTGSTTTEGSTGSGSGSTSTSGAQPSSTGSNTVCFCAVDADCGDNTCVAGRCSFACDNTCPAACQKSASCGAPCDYFCPSLCTSSGTCPLCDERPSTHTTEPTSG